MPGGHRFSKVANKCNAPISPASSTTIELSTGSLVIECPLAELFVEPSAVEWVSLPRSSQVSSALATPSSTLLQQPFLPPDKTALKLVDHQVFCTKHPQ